MDIQNFIRTDADENRAALEELQVNGTHRAPSCIPAGIYIPPLRKKPNERSDWLANEKRKAINARNKPYGDFDRRFVESAKCRVKNSVLMDAYYAETFDGDDGSYNPEDDLIDAIDEASAPSFDGVNERIEDFNDTWMHDDLNRYKRIYKSRFNPWEGCIVSEELKPIHPVPEIRDEDETREARQLSRSLKRRSNERMYHPCITNPKHNSGRKPRNDHRRDTIRDVAQRHQAYFSPTNL